MNLPRKSILLVLLICTNTFAQSFSLNKGIWVCLKKICNYEKSGEVVLETSVFAYYKEKNNSSSDLLNMLNNFSYSEMENWVSNSFCINPRFDSKLNLGESCFKNAEGLKIHLTDDSRKFIDTLNSFHCFDSESKVVAREKVSVVYPCQPVEFAKNTYLLVFTVNEAYRYYQGERFVGIKLSKNAEEKLYLFVVKVIKNKPAIVLVRKIAPFGFFCSEE